MAVDWGADNATQNDLDEFVADAIASGYTRKQALRILDRIRDMSPEEFDEMDQDGQIGQYLVGEEN